MAHVISSHSAPTVQAKLKVSEPNDKYEQEADRVAEMLMLMPEPGSISQLAAPIPSIGGAIQRLCVECDEELYRQPVDVEEGPLDEEAHQPPEAASGPESLIRSLRSAGQPLPESVRAFFEPRFGFDFRDVRIHADAVAAQAARSVRAQAYALDHHIVFGSGQYQPTTTPGRRLIAHELTHVIQQQGRAMPKSTHLSGTRQADGRGSAPLPTPVHKVARAPMTSPNWPMVFRRGARSAPAVGQQAQQPGAPPGRRPPRRRPRRTRVRRGVDAGGRSRPRAVRGRGGSPPHFISVRTERLQEWEIVESRQVEFFHVFDAFEYWLEQAFEKKADIAVVLVEFGLADLFIPEEARQGVARVRVALMNPDPEGTESLDPDSRIRIGIMAKVLERHRRRRRGCMVEPVAMKHGRYVCHADYAKTFSGVRLEFRVTTPGLDFMDFDACGGGIACDQGDTLFEVKTGYGWILNENLSDYWLARKQSVVDQFIDQSEEQLHIARMCGHPLVWYFNSEHVAEFFHSLLQVSVQYKRFDCKKDSDHTW